MVAGIPSFIITCVSKMKRILEEFSSSFKEHSVLLQCCCLETIIHLYLFHYFCHPLIATLGVTLEELRKLIRRKLYLVYVFEEYLHWYMRIWMHIANIQVRSLIFKQVFSGPQGGMNTCNEFMRNKWGKQAYYQLTWIYAVLPEEILLTVSKLLAWRENRWHSCQRKGSLIVWSLFFW